jgi:hypothetical protein
MENAHHVAALCAVVPALRLTACFAALGPRRCQAVGMATNVPYAQILAWHAQYPNPAATAEQNAESRAAEDRWLMSFAELSELDRNQVTELIDWKFQSMPHRRARAMRVSLRNSGTGGYRRRSGGIDPPGAGGTG